MRVPVESINRQRFAAWERRLNEEHSTPLFLLGIGHDEHSGRPVVEIPQGVQQDQVLGLLKAVIYRLEHPT